jgi:hypothetical protein
MNDNIRARAINASIEKWEQKLALARAKKFDAISTRVDSCPLCEQFHAEQAGNSNCKLCPIYERTGHPYCRSTPYEEVLAALGDLTELNGMSCRELVTAEQRAEYFGKFFPKLLTAIEKEIAFLHSLKA